MLCVSCVVDLLSSLCCALLTVFPPKAIVVHSVPFRLIFSPVDIRYHPLLLNWLTDKTLVTRTGERREEGEFGDGKPNIARRKLPGQDQPSGGCVRAGDCVDSSIQQLTNQNKNNRTGNGLLSVAESA